MTLQEYIASLRGRTVAVIGIGVSNTPLLRLLLREGIAVTACDRSDRAKLGALAEELEAAGAVLRLGDGYLQDLDQDVIFRTGPAARRAGAGGRPGQGQHHHLRNGGVL